MNVLLKLGWLLGFVAVFLQIAVFLQPLLPAQYQVAPVCESISIALAQSSFSKQMNDQPQHSALQHGPQQHQVKSTQVKQPQHDHYDPSHQCQYCTVYGNLILPPELSINAVIDRVQVRLVALQKAFHHVYFVLQRLFLIPQGRAPPLLA